jgi:hypothetical protein
MAEYTREQIIRQMYAANKANRTQDVEVLRSMLESQGMLASKSPRGEIDFDSGGGYAQRYAVDTAGSDPAAQLAALRKTRPDAVPYGDGNFMYHNPETFQPKILNSEGYIPDAYEISRVGKLGTQVLGGIGSAVLAAPTTPIGQLAVAGTGATASGVAYDKALEQLFDADDSRGMGEQVKDAAIETALNMIPIEKTGKVLSFAGQQIKKIPTVTPTLNAISGLMRNADDRISELAQKYNINPTTGVLGNKFLAMAEAVSQKTLGAEAGFMKSWDEFSEGFSTMLNDFHLSLGGSADPTSAGNKLLGKAQKYVENFKAHSQKLYDDVPIPVNSQVPSPNLNAFLAEYGEKFSQDALKDLTQNPKLLKLSENLDQPLTWKEIKELRTAIGKMISDRKTSKSLEGVPQSDLKTLYGALTDDLFEASKLFGDDALEAARKANDYYRAGATVIDDIIDPLFKTGTGYKTGADVFATVKRQAADPEKLGVLRDVDGLFNQGDFDAVGSAMMNDLGMATKAGQNATADRVSPERVIGQTSTQAIPQASQDILFNGSAKEIMADMRVFAEATQGVSQNINRSNTAMAIQASSAGAGLLDFSMSGNPMGLVQAVGTFFMPYLASKGLQSEAMKRWLGGAPKEASEQAVKEWMQVGKRIFYNENLQNVWDAFNNGSSDGTKRGALEE